MWVGVAWTIVRPGCINLKPNSGNRGHKRSYPCSLSLYWAMGYFLSHYNVGVAVGVSLCTGMLVCVLYV